jgi:hypothetical protein
VYFASSCRSGSFQLGHLAELDGFRLRTLHSLPAQRIHSFTCGRFVGGMTMPTRERVCVCVYVCLSTLSSATPRTLLKHTKRCGITLSCSSVVSFFTIQSLSPCQLHLFSSHQKSNKVRHLPATLLAETTPRWFLAVDR